MLEIYVPLEGSKKNSRLQDTDSFLYRAKHGWLQHGPSLGHPRHDWLQLHSNYEEQCKNWDESLLYNVHGVLGYVYL